MSGEKLLCCVCSEEIRMTKGHWKQKIEEYERSTKHQDKFRSGRPRQSSIFNLFQKEMEKRFNFMLI